MKKDPLHHQVKTFLERNAISSRPILLGYSGGPDSLALLHLLMDCDIDLHLAHVDHQWRNESSAEALDLAREAKRLSLPFHLHEITTVQEGDSNLEDKFRRERLQFFQKVYQDLNCQALLLAHHLDDQAETVMKRLFEGAGLLHLGGLSEISQFEQMTIWRPLLPFNKGEILSFLKKQGLKRIDDHTNRDTKYLRARMREVIFPGIEKQFRKGIGRNLHRLGSSFQELRAYLDLRVERYFSGLQQTKKGYSIELAPFYPLEKVEFKHFIQLFCLENRLSLSHSHLETLFHLLESQAFNKQIRSKDWQITVFGQNLEVEIGYPY